MSQPQFVSVHGGHSGQFCNHAQDTLEEIVKKYIQFGYSWIGITEHVPPVNDSFLYPDEKEAGLTARILSSRFETYIEECRRLQVKYSDQITLYCAMEIETYSGYDSLVPILLKKYRPDYIVGSIHFVDDMGFDYSKSNYDKTAEAVGGYDNLYCRYFDQQFEMLKRFKPSVVGHFDLIRIYDPNYKKRLKKMVIKKRILRNLELIKELDLIMDFNIRALSKGADEPYITDSILSLAREMNISVVPGDDSHAIKDVHQNMEQVMTLLRKSGFSLDWPKPKLYQ